MAGFVGVGGAVSARGGVPVERAGEPPWGAHENRCQKGVIVGDGQELRAGQRRTLGCPMACGFGGGRGPAERQGCRLREAFGCWRSLEDFK